MTEVVLAVVLTVGLVFVALGVVLATDGVERFWANRGRRGRRSPTTRYYESPFLVHQVEPGCCKSCGMDDLPLDYYRRCLYCAELCDLKGGVSSRPQMVYQGELINELNTWRMYGNRPEPAADISSYSRERIWG